jgi:hypothetical protein
LKAASGSRRHGRWRRRDRADRQRQLGTMAAGLKDGPVDAAIVGIIDRIDINQK